jgi:hypothetical protein
MTKTGHTRGPRIGPHPGFICGLEEYELIWIGFADRLYSS